MLILIGGPIVYTFRSQDKDISKLEYFTRLNNGISVTLVRFRASKFENSRPIVYNVVKHLPYPSKK